MSESNLSKGEQRREQILAVLKAERRLTIADMIERFGCSEATARRDLDLLEKMPGVIRTIGGAIYEGLARVREVSFNEKKEQLWLEKEAIARKAASLITDGDVICLTGGTTTFLIARELKNQQAEGITIVTNAVNIAMELADCSGIQVVVTGGVLRGSSFELCGPLAEKTVEDLNIGTMFMGIDGLTPEHGATTYSELEARIARLFMARTKRTIAVFDHTKIGRTSLFSIAPLASLNGCITNRLEDRSLAEAITQNHIPLHLAN
jgi:DeoR/GlpR family transcriptional regulator of sugar metabolism